MKSALEIFESELCQEHFEEASFLYELRKGLIHDPRFCWPDVAAFENRLEAHLDALTQAGAAALSLLEEQELVDEPGNLFTAVALCCRLQNYDALAATLTRVEEAPGESTPGASTPGESTRDESTGEEIRQTALTDGLWWFCPPAWVPKLLERFGHVPALAPHWIRLLGRSGDPGPARELERFRGHEALFPLLAEAYADLGALHAVSWLQGGLERRPPARSAAAFALLRLRTPDVAATLSAAASKETELLLPLSLALDAEQTPALFQRAQNVMDLAEDHVLALGFSGSARAVAPLIQCLRQGVHPPTAAVALRLISGQTPREEVFIPEEIDEDSLFPEEKQRLERGEPLETKNGEDLVRLSQNPEDWLQWQREAASFQPGIRYRLGQPLTQAAPLAHLRDPFLPARVRTLIYWEWQMRYGLPEFFHVEMPVERQQRLFTACEAWLKKRAPQAASQT